MGGNRAHTKGIHCRYYYELSHEQQRLSRSNMAFVSVFLRALSSTRLARALCFSSDGYNCRCIITQSHEANQIHIQFTSTRVYQCFFTSRKSCYLSMFSLSAPENNFPTDQTDGIGCHFVFADRVKCSRIPFS